MHLRCRSVLSTLSVLAIAAVCSPLASAADDATAKKYSQMVDKAVAFLGTKGQAADGSFSAQAGPAVTGLVATAFTHRDSRAGDPDLHTHVAVANKVQTLVGKWLSIDGRLLFKAKVSASETYNTALEHHLTDACPDRVERDEGPAAGFPRHGDGLEDEQFAPGEVGVFHRRHDIADDTCELHGQTPESRT